VKGDGVGSSVVGSLEGAAVLLEETGLSVTFKTNAMGDSVNF